VTDLVDIQLADSSARTPDAQRIRGWVAAVFTTLGRSPLALTVRVIDEEEMAKLNRRYRGRNQSTNVLSFPIGPLPGMHTDLLGDIVVCGPVVDREAAIQHKSPMGHWAHMVVHGLLHLFGYNHESDQDAIVMEALEKSVLEGLGYSDPYQGERDSSTDSRA
jgi:probable rRNA maturation factor